MKFVVSGITKCAPRIGNLKEIERYPNMNLKTPMAMLYTRGGSIPHITNEVFKLISENSQIIQIPLVSTYNFEEAMTEFHGNISEFVGMKECISCVTVQDPGDYTQSGHHVQDYIPLWTRQGKVLINAKTYMNSVELFKPDMYYILSDGDTNAASPAKRINKAVKNTITYFKQCLERHEKSEMLKNTFVMGAIAGGYNIKSRKFCIDAVCRNDIIQGYLIDGLHNNGPEVELVKIEEIQPIVEFVINNLPPNKLRAIHGCWNPLTILHLVQLGVDLFDTSYCHVVTERSCALIFSLDFSNEDSDYELNLHQPQYAEDFGPILADCTCLTCTKYSRGYIHHLVAVQELLGPLLLTIHNVHHYMKFFEKIREYIQDDKLNTFQELIAKQFNKAQYNNSKQENILSTQTDTRIEETFPHNNDINRDFDEERNNVENVSASDITIEKIY